MMDSGERLSTSTSTTPHVDNVLVVDEKNVLETLGAIKAKVSSLLKALQKAQLSAEAEGAAAAMSKVEPNPMAEGDMKETVVAKKTEVEAVSREDVKAQREAKKEAKAARKNKSLGGDKTLEDKTASKKKDVKEKKTPNSGGGGEGETPKSGQNPVKLEKSKTVGTTSTTTTSTTTATTTTTSKPKQETTMTATEGNPVTKSPTAAAAAPISSTPKPITEILLEVNVTTKHATEPPPSAFDQNQRLESLLEKVHPKFKELGLKYSNYVLRGSNQRTLALLSTTKSYIMGYRTPDGKGFKQDISAQLQFYFDKLKLYRPFAVGMTTAVEGVNAAICGLEEGLLDQEYKEELGDWVDRFVEEKIIKAVEAIAQKGADKISNEDTILIFSLNEPIYDTFKLAARVQGKRFNLILATTKSDHYLREFIQLKESMGENVLRNHVNISCISISSIMSFIPTVDKVFLGGHALFTTGGVMAHAGASIVALCASHHNIPVIFFCETYKFCDKSPTDAFYSDIFPENEFSFSTSVGDKAEEGSMMARICYDVTPVDLVTCVITDIDMLPSSSVPVVLRVQESRPLTKCM